MDYYKIGQRIRKFRKACGLSQEELAAAVNISTTHMSHIETGNTKLSLPVLVDIAATLEVGTDDILTDGTPASKSAVQNEIAAILEQCTPEESKVLAEIVEAAKQAFDKYL